jgi:hypothetical protein
MTKESLFDIAMRYLEIGLTPIPCHAPSALTRCSCKLGNKCISPAKHPALAWERYKDHHVDADQVKVWFHPDGGMYNALNVGLVTGTISNNIFAVDVDCGDGKQGDESIRALQVLNDDLPPTMETTTGGGGRHYYYRAPAGVQIITDKNV